MKRIFALILSLAFAAACIAMPVSAASTAKSGSHAVFSVPEVLVRPGGTVDIPLSISGNYEAHGLTIWLVFDNDALQLDGYANGGVLSDVSAHGGTFIYGVKVENGKNSVRLGIMMPTEPFSAQGVLFTTRLTVKPGVAAGTVLDLEIHLRPKDFIYMPIGDHNGTPIPFTLSPGKLTVSNYAPTPTPGVTPTSARVTPTPTPIPTSTPVTPTAPPSSAPATPTPRPSSAPATPTPRPGSTAAPATPTPRPGTTAAPATPTPPPTPGTDARSTAQPDTSESPDPFARFSASPFPTAGVSPTPGGPTADPFARFSQSPAPAETDYAPQTPAPFDTIPPTGYEQLPELPARKLPVGLIAAVGAGATALGAGLVILLVKRRRDDE